jgi:hypothetical protein
MCMCVCLYMSIYIYTRTHTHTHICYLLVFNPRAILGRTRAQPGDRYVSGTLYAGQFLRVSLPLLSPIYTYSYLQIHERLFLKLIPEFYHCILTSCSFKYRIPKTIFLEQLKRFNTVCYFFFPFLISFSVFAIKKWCVIYLTRGVM